MSKEEPKEEPPSPHRRLLKKPKTGASARVKVELGTITVEPSVVKIEPDTVKSKPTSPPPSEP
jgi:hypothetical protein